MMKAGEDMARPTLHDVAKLSGVSTATVSHVINGTRKVSEETRERVNAAIRALGYQQNLSARQLKTGVNYTIGFVVPDITNLFYATVVQRVSDYCMERGYSLLSVNTFEQPHQEQAHLRMLCRQPLGGLIIASTVERYADIAEYAPRVPTLFFDRSLDDCPFECIRINAYQAYYDAAADLVQKGHRRIGYLAGLQRISTSRERLQAFEDALSAADFPEANRFICSCDSIATRTMDETYRLLKEGCTAIIASNRNMLLAATYALARKGVRIGEEVQLVGSTENTPILPFADRINLISQPIDLVADFLAASIIRKIEQPDAALHIPTFYSVYEPL